MKFREQTKNTVEGDSFHTIQSSVDKRKLAKLYGILSNIYKNPIASIVREYTCNALDANNEGYNFLTQDWNYIQANYPWVNDPELEMTEVEFLQLKSNLQSSGKDSPIVVGIDNKSAQRYFYVKDFGIGLSMKRLENIFFNYLSTTKEGTDDEIGGFGIGAKSALAYSDNFFITTVYDNTEYQCMMVKDERGIPQGNILMVTENCNKPNGTIIKIPIEQSNENDFMEAIVNQLSYMPNVIIENQLDINKYTSALVPNITNLFNDNVIYDTPLWRYSTAYDNDDSITICLENVTYQIDWTALGISRVNWKLGLKFKTGELEPTPSRESIVYTKEAIALIKDRIEQVVRQVYVDFSKEIVVPDLQAALDLGRISKYDHIIPIDDEHKIKLDTSSSSIAWSDYNLSRIQVRDRLRILDCPLPKKFYPGLHDWFFAFKFNRKLIYKDGTHIYNNTDAQSMFTQKTPVFKFMSQPTGSHDFEHTKNKFVLDCVGEDVYSFYFIYRWDNGAFSSSVETNLGMFGHNLTNNEKKAIFKKYLTYVMQFIAKHPAYLGSYDALEINPNWYTRFLNGDSKFSTQRAKAVRRTGYIVKRQNVYSQDSIELKENQLKNKLIYYAEHEDRDRLKSWLKTMYKWDKLVAMRDVLVCTVSKTNCKKFAEMDLPNMISLERLISHDGSYRKTRRLVTAYLLKQRLEKLNFKQVVWDNVDERIEDIYKDLKKYSTINHYANHNVDTIWTAFVDVYVKNGLVDQTKLDEMQVLENYFAKVPLLKHIHQNDAASHDGSIFDYLKLKKVKAKTKLYLK